TLLHSLRWYHLGFAFVWAIAFAGLSFGDDVSAGQRLFSLSDQGCAIAAVCTAALYERHRMPFPHNSALIVGALLAAGSLAYFLTFRGMLDAAMGAVGAGVLVGAALGSSYVLWQQFFASEGASRTAIYIPLSALLSVVLSAVVSVLPDGARIVCTVVVLPLAAAVSLRRCLREIVVADPPPRMTGSSAAATLKALWKPAFCTCAIGFVWKLVSHLFAIPGGASFAPILGGMALAVAVVVLIELFSETGFAVLRLYQILFPLITGVFLLPTLLGPQFAPVLASVLFFGFEIVNLLLIVTCAVYSSERNLPSTQVYALCVGPTLAAMLVGDVVGTRLNPFAAYDFAIVVNILFLCIYGLSLALFFVAFSCKGRRGKAGLEGAEHDIAVVGLSGERESAGNAPSKGVGSASASGLAGEASLPAAPEASASEKGANDGAVDMLEAIDLAALLERRMDSLALDEPFSKREREVVGLVLRGNNVPAIARKLYISENTARDHMKSIYRKAGIHSRQELIDLFD
ncbi:MAG: helix-turn-helix transcriptional regulator, partial [Gordonibacter sp.]|uniref:helix-turn-helix transcriptional regulator n=1 Tax=Gordonibacter sp. TaxID=1968902 RepID=UPI002FCA6158